MKTYYIFRHGETFVTASIFGIGWYGFHNREVHILQSGIPTIKRLAGYLKNIPTDLNFCSEYLRCRETAKIVTDITGKKFTTDNRLNDYTSGSFKNFSGRLNDFIKYTQTSPGKIFLICTHGANISGISRLLLTGKFSLWQALQYPRPGILTIVKNGKKTIMDFNK